MKKAWVLSYPLSKTRISLGIRPVWSESLLSAWRKLGSLATHWAHSEDLLRLGGCPGWSESSLGSHSLAHLSQRLTRWAYSIAVVRHPSVHRRCRPHFQSWISLRPVGQSWSKFMCSITGMGERLHKVLGQIRSKLWFPWQQKAPIDL